jgi:hypothetical protein
MVARFHMIGGAVRDGRRERVCSSAAKILERLVRRRLHECLERAVTLGGRKRRVSETLEETPNRVAHELGDLVTAAVLAPENRLAAPVARHARRRARR